MNICMSGSEIAPSTNGVLIGGVTSSVFRLSSQLSIFGEEIHIITSRPRVFDDKPYNYPFDITQIPMNSTYPSFKYGLELLFKSFFLIRKENSKKQFDIIHGHSGEPSVAAIPNLCKTFLKNTCIHTLYCPIRPDDRYAKYAFRDLDFIIAITENVKNSILQFGVPEEKIAVIPPAIDTDKFNPNVPGQETREKYGLSKSDNSLLFVGNLSKTKGIDILLDSMKIIKKDFPDIKLFMTLEMPHEKFSERKEEIKKKIENYDLSNNVVEFGIIDNMNKLIAASDILVAPFLDTFGPSDYPIPVLEAMSCAKPVVSTKIGGLPEIVFDDETGYLVNPNNADELADALKKLLNDRNLQTNIGRNASELINKNFSMKNVAKKTVKIYEAVSKK